MKKSTIILLSTVGVVLLLVAMFFSSYNGFMNSEEDVDNKYAQIDNQLQRRMDLIPNLVNTVQGYASHEKEVMSNIADARAKLAGAKTPTEQAEANDQLSGALSRLLMVSENYPNLKADSQFTRLMDELSGSENRIAVARKDYNDQVTVYNKKVKRMPGAIIANMFGFDEKELFKAAENAKNTPSVDFNKESK